MLIFIELSSLHQPLRAFETVVLISCEKFASKVDSGWLQDTHEALASWTTGRKGSVISRLSNPLQAQLLYAFDSEQASSREKVTGLSEADGEV
ncbi:hypothetical protein GL273_02305 [Aeromonas jandaei]|uniref:hypothetical protein n=1 Tax=Aeromonas jandaei TaxID=650 RepID=UPI001C5ACE4C|nr:hypothetical protein [Aeromonas jandaei]MBW3804661.1 hypothetical protein [Aeromonas jandaei]